MKEPPNESEAGKAWDCLPESYRSAAEDFLKSYSTASDPEFLVSAYQWVFGRGLDETGYVCWLTQLFGGCGRLEVLRHFLSSEESQTSFRELSPVARVGVSCRCKEDFSGKPLEQYQDIWIKGRLARPGVRECAARFDLIREFCSRYRRPFTVLDLGANLGYFSIRLAESFDCTAVAVEGLYSDWAEDVISRNENPRVVLFKKTVSLEDLRALSQVEHFDVVLALSVVHHLEGTFQDNLEVLRSLGDHLIMELPFERSACRPDKVRSIAEAGLPEGGVSLGRAASHLEEGCREIVLLSRPKTKIEKAYLGTPRGGLDLEIESSFEAKRVRFKNKPEAREWIRGINLQTYLWFNGARPHRSWIAERLRDKGTPSVRHRDIQPWNAILQGDEVSWIDFDDPNHAFTYPDDGHLDRLIRLLTAGPCGGAAESGGSPEAVSGTASGSTVGNSPFKVRRPVRWMGPVFNPSGYASELINFVLPLEMRLDIGIFHHNSIYSESFVSGLPEREKAALFRMRDRFKRLSGGIVVSHNPGNSLVRPPDGDFLVGRTMFETDRLPKDWIGNCNLMDEIWVPSRFNLESFSAAGVSRDKIHVIPGVVNGEHFDPERHMPLPLNAKAAYNFLSIFEWSSRKGWDVLLSAYLREFSAEDDVCLHLRTYLFSRPDEEAEGAIRRRIEEYGRSLGLGDKPWPRIEILAEQVPEAELPGLYMAVDCLVAPSRGEGWGRPQHEAMMMGLPVIATAWSGNTEFMNEQNSFLLEHRLVEAKFLEPELWQYRGHRWADPSEAHLRRLMRSLEQDPQAGRRRGSAARSQMLERFSRQPVAEKVIERLEDIERRISTPALPAVLGRATEAPGPSPGILEGLRLRWDGPTDDSGSLAHVNREMKAALSRRGRVSLVEDAEVDRGGGVGCAAPFVRLVTVGHRWPPCFDLPDSGLRVLMQPWEYGALPREWVARMGGIDEIWVYSEFLRRCYVDSGVDPSKIRVVPLGIDPVKFHPEAEPADLSTEKRFRFLFVGGTIRRKGPDVLLKAYCEAFGFDDDVCLVVKDFGGDGVYRGQTLGEEIRRLQRTPNLPEIVYLDQEWPPERLPGLYSACHCLVHPYRGEGFGLPVLEAMACGLPVIVTGGGATDDFAYGEWAVRIPARSVNIGTEVASFQLVRNGRLLEPELKSLVEELRRIFENREEARRRGLLGSREARRNWTWDRAAALVEFRLADLTERRLRSEKEIQALAESATPEDPLPVAAKVGDLSEAREGLAHGKFEDAWSKACAAIERRPFHPEGFHLLARIAQAAGDSALARRALDRALQLLPSWKPALQLQKALRRKKPTRSPAWRMPARRKAPALTVCLVVKDAQAGLERALASVRPIADQLVVVDTGSSDGSVETARRLGAEVLAVPWDEGFSKARNRALEVSRGDWILMVDADEELPSCCAEKLAKLTCDPSVLGYFLPVREMDDDFVESEFWRLKLFRNVPGVFYRGRVYEEVRDSLEASASEWGLAVSFGEAPVLHHRDHAPAASRDRLERNLKLLEGELEDSPGDPRIRVLMGIEVARTGRVPESVSWLEGACRLLSQEGVPPPRPDLLERLLIHLSAARIRLKRYRETLELLEMPVARTLRWSASLYFQRGLVRMELGAYDEAAEDFRRALELRGEPGVVEPVANLRGVGPWHCLARCLEGANQAQEAERVFRVALEKHPDSRLVRFDLARFLAERDETTEALQILCRLVEEDPEQPEVWKAGGRILRKHPELSELGDQWTARAVACFPREQELLFHRAEVLLLRGRVDEALELWLSVDTSDVPDAQAALFLCRLVSGQAAPRLEKEAEPQVSRAFLRWCRRLERASAEGVLEEIRARLETLGSLLPKAARRLEVELRRSQRLAESPNSQDAGSGAEPSSAR